MAPTTWVDTCGCWRPLHYNSPAAEAHVRRVVEVHGDTVRVDLCDGRSYRVPRHYIALHGILGADVAMLATIFEWPEVEGEG